MLNSSLFENDSVTVKMIMELLEKYKIGKKPLAKLLGWGETTIIRYIEGDIPTKEYSDKLNLVFCNPGFYYETLLKNRENITQVAFNKSQNAVLREMMKSKINIVSQYIINLRRSQISSLELQNMLYYVQGFSLVFLKNPMFEDEYMVSTDYVPYPRIYEEFKVRPITCLSFDDTYLSDKEKILIEGVVGAFDWYGLKTIKSYISYERALLKISRDKDNNKIVTKDTLRSYFKELRVAYLINGVYDIKKYPDKRYADLREGSFVCIK